VEVIFDCQDEADMEGSAMSLASMEAAMSGGGNGER
jgi:hypothetical protein